MTFIPPITTPAAQIAGSAAGAQRREGLADQTAEAGAAQRLASDREELAARSLGDVGQMDGSADRDADGRRYDDAAAPPLDEDAEDTPDATAGNSPRVRTADPSGERGSRLDLDA